MEAEIKNDQGSDVVDFNTEGGVEQKALRAGEYELRIIKAEMRSGEKDGRPWKSLNLTHDPFAHVEAKYIYDSIFFPDEESTEKQINAFKNKMGALKQALGYAHSDSFRPNELVGRTLWAVVSVRESEEYGRQNSIVRYVTGASADKM